MYFFNSKRFFDSSVALLKSKWFLFVLGIPFFFCLHRYDGIANDARLYLMQVVHSWFPERFLNDPPFMFGNQDNYGFFTFFYSQILKVLPIDKGALLCTLFGQCLCLVAAYYFIYQFSRRLQIRLWYTPLLLCFIVYSGANMPNDHIFFWHFVESTAVSRLYSLAIAFWGLGSLFAQKKFVSLALFLLGSAIHPLTAGWCLPLWLFLYYPKTLLPVVVFSAALPLTFLLRRGLFDIYPVDWGNCTHDHPIMYLMFWREFVALIFWGLFVPKFTSNKFFLKFTKAVFWVMLIGLYWLSTGGVAKHILIYQVQTWRVEWLFFILALPFFAYLIYGQVLSFRHKGFHGLTTRHIALLLMGYSLFMPAPCTGAVILSLALLLVPVRRWNLNCSLMALAFMCVLSASAQELTNAFLLGLINIPLIEVTDMFRESGNLIFLQFLWIIGIVFLCLYKIKAEKQDVKFLWSVVFILIAYAFFPQFQLLPVALAVYLLYLKKRIDLKLLIPMLLICIGDCFLNTGYRETSILGGFPKQILQVTVFAVPVIAGIVVFYIKIPDGIRKVILIALSLVLAVFAYNGYDKRAVSLKQYESRLDLFKENVIFPQVKDRGKIFYYVSGDYAYESRVQFLSGSYFSETTTVGEALFQGHFIEERKRLNYIFFKEQRGYIAKRTEWRKFVQDSLSNKSFLLDRVEFLCSINEISHIVSDLQLTELEKLDSYRMTEKQTVYLYRCPNDDILNRNTL